MSQKKVPNLLFNIDRMHIEQITEFIFPRLIIDSKLSWKAHLNGISTKTSRIIGLLHNKNIFFPNKYCTQYINPCLCHT